jgi:hypothetical protein
MPPVSPPMMINVKQRMVREIFFVLMVAPEKKIWKPLLSRLKWKPTDIRPFAV